MIEDKEKELVELRRKQKDIGVAVGSLNRLPVFEPSLKPQFKERSFRNAYGKVFVIGRLGQDHKNLLETILYKRKAYRTYKDEEGNRCFEVLYDEYEVRKYLGKKSVYCKTGYQSLIEDMKQAYIEIETKELIVKGKLITDKTLSGIYSKQTKSNLPGLKDEKIPYAVLKLGSVTNLLINKELRFTYDPKPIMMLGSGISQAMARYLKTHRSHPSTGYHLKALLENLIENVEGDVWKNIRRFLKKDAELLEQLGIVIDFKADRLFVIQNTLKLKNLL
jgi:hypothetical protein